MFSLGTKAHHSLNTGPVVPTAVKEHEFLSCRQVRHIALEVPRCPVTIGGFAKGDHPGLAWAQMLDNAFDRAVLPRCVPTLQDDQNLVVALDEVPLQLDQFDLELVQGVLIDLFRDRMSARRLVSCFSSS